MKSVSFIFILSMFIMTTNTVNAQASMSTDEMAIHQIVQDMQDGWNAKSGERFAAHFADDHDYIVWNGMYNPHCDRTINAQGHQGLYNSVYKTMDIGLKVDKVRFVKPDVAMTHVFVNNAYDGQPGPNFPQYIITMMMTKNDGNWEIVSFHNNNIEYDQLLRKPAPTDEEKLAYAKENYEGWYK